MMFELLRFLTQNFSGQFDAEAARRNTQEKKMLKRGYNPRIR
jgi:hypothetical protein